MPKTFTPNHMQLCALVNYAQKHGRTWKSSLQAEWMTATASQLLMQVRNQAGPSWLVAFRLHDAVARLAATTNGE